MIIQRNRSPYQMLFVLAIIFLSFGCNSANNTPTINRTTPLTEWVRHDEWSENTKFAKWDINLAGIVVGLLEPQYQDTHPYERPDITKYFLKEEENSFDILLLLHSGYDTQYPVLVSVLLDYNQLPSELDGKTGILHYINIEPGVDMEIPMKISVNEPGWHDLTIVVFPHPESHPENQEERLPPSFGTAGTRRVICKNNCDHSDSLLPQPIVASSFGESVSQNSIIGFPLLKGDARPQSRLLLSTAIPSGADLPLEFWSRNPATDTLNYVVLPFLDFQQVHTTESPSSVISLEMPPQSELFTPVHLNLSEQSTGMHELQFVYIFDPFNEPEDISNPFVQSFLRSLIKIE